MKKEVLKKLGDHVLDSDEEEEVLEDKFNSMVQSAVESGYVYFRSWQHRVCIDFKSQETQKWYQIFSRISHKRSVEEGTKIQEAKKDAVGYGLQD